MGVIVGLQKLGSEIGLEPVIPKPAAAVPSIRFVVTMSEESRFGQALEISRRQGLVYLPTGGARIVASPSYAGELQAGIGKQVLGLSDSREECELHRNREHHLPLKHFIFSLSDLS